MKQPKKKFNLSPEQLRKIDENVKRSLDKEGFTLYSNQLHKVHKMRAKDLAIFYFLCESMHAVTNEIFVDDILRARYISLAQRAIGSREFAISKSDWSRRVAILVEHGMIIQKDGYYVVNPKHAFKGTKQQRKTTMKDLACWQAENGHPVTVLSEPLPQEPEMT